MPHRKAKHVPEHRRIRRLQSCAQGLLHAHPLGQRRVGRDFALGLGVLRGVELAVEVGHQRLFVHHPFPNMACSASRPRAMRLVSVPIGISSTSAASL